MSSTLISKKSTKTARRSLHNPQHIMMKSPAQCRAFCWCLSAMSCLHQKKSRQLIHVLPSSLILLVSFPAGMLPETFESRERIGASASRGGKPVRPGRFHLSATASWGPERSGEAAEQGENTNRRGGWSLDRKHRIRTTPRPAFQGPPVILFFQWPDANAGVATGETGHSSLSAGGGLEHFGFHRCIKPWKDCHTNAIMRKYAPRRTNQSK
ncbi:hypothetical protein DEV92_103253 [Phyllobacterium myrsinacearum]|nr:hypothetical protein DEV92_103253 [Phyllobacterium myrsinacearum]RZV07483.1 hypothetical protein EV654_2155 [Phyllobacterium myrsinacearum]